MSTYAKAFVELIRTHDPLSFSFEHDEITFNLWLTLGDEVHKFPRPGDVVYNYKTLKIWVFGVAGLVALEEENLVKGLFHPKSQDRRLWIDAEGRPHWSIDTDQASTQASVRSILQAFGRSSLVKETMDGQGFQARKRSHSESGINSREEPSSKSKL